MGGGATGPWPWIHGSTYDLTAKYTVDGAVDWPGARFTARLDGALLRITGNGLPAHATGIFPIRSSDDAYQVDRNPNGISSYALSEALDATPTRNRRARCAGGTVGIATNGIPLFSPLDVGGRDAVAREVQDRCSGHPQASGVYHYHGLPGCLFASRGTAHSKRIGWALDGFPIHGPLGRNGRYMRLADLDRCHGHTHRIRHGGAVRRLFHYHATDEFPYLVGCFRGTPRTLDLPAPSGPPGGGPPPP